jgi:transcriptional regulator with XRE-family HTH domain
MRDNLIKFRGIRSQAQMGSIYGVTQQAWSKWEKSISAPSLSVMKRISDDSGIPIEELFFDLFNNSELLNK